MSAPGTFANDGQYLLVNAASLADLNARMAAGHGCEQLGGGGMEGGMVSGAPFGPPQVDIGRFRPNLVVSGFAAYAEDGWSSVSVGALQCGVLGTCPRCEMLQVDQSAGVRVKADVLLALAQYRRRGGKVHFGVLLAADSAEQSHAASPPTLESHTAAATTTSADGRLSSPLHQQHLTAGGPTTPDDLGPSAAVGLHDMQGWRDGCDEWAGTAAGMTILRVGDMVLPRKPCS
ncbi:MAG: hypothetical protein WDW38_007732 [Sanguina aurantia]